MNKPLKKADIPIGTESGKAEQANSEVVGVKSLFHSKSPDGVLSVIACQQSLIGSFMIDI
jgi:hypothetical protein